MPVTAQDWRVTAQQEVTRSLAHVERATDAGDLDNIDVLRECWAAYQAAGAAVGSWAQGMAVSGRSWSEIGAALDLPEHDVVGALQPLVARGWATLVERLPSATQTDDPPPAAERRALPWVTRGPAAPLRELEGDLAERVAGLGARQVNLYRSLAHTPELLDAWIDWAWALRGACQTPRRLRELMILRTAIVMRSEYEWHQHEPMALAAGATREQVDALTAWQVSSLFDPAEKAALTLTDAMLTGNVPDAVHDELRRHFDDQERVELVLTAGFYAMVPRVLDALRVPVEGPSHD
jgi:alkylhydroperoxidase family enzyme